MVQRSAAPYSPLLGHWGLIATPQMHMLKPCPHGGGERGWGLWELTRVIR